MNIEEINKKIQIEKASFKRNLNRLQKEMFELRQRHQRTMEYWQRQKEQTTKQNTNESILFIFNERLQKFL